MRRRSDEPEGALRWVIARGREALRPAPAADDLVRARVARALRRLASGDLGLDLAAELAGTEEGAAIEKIVGRVRGLVVAGRSAADRPKSAAAMVGAASGRLAELSNRQKVTLDRAAEEARTAAQRAKDLRGVAAEVAEAVERAGLVALNTGIEGMRAGGETARALSALGEEIRRLNQRAAAGAGELGVAVEEMDAALGGALARVDEAREHSRSIGEAAVQSSAEAEAARRAERSFGEELEGWRVRDDETEALLAGVIAGVEQLARELGALRERLGDGDEARGRVERALRALTGAEADGGGGR